MDRLEVIKLLMQQKKLKNYCEIGVNNGHVLFRIKSTFKIAVDPEFVFDAARKFGKKLLNPYNVFNRYFEKTSDDFFAQDAPRLFTGKKIDIALIDGMHEYYFALRDVENTLKHLSDDGVIVMHDCNPPSKEMACSFEEWKARNFTGLWNGDVWKSIVHLRSLRNDINVFVLDCDHGLGIVSRGKPDKMLYYTKQQIQNLTYENLDANRTALLNLKAPDYLYDFFNLKR